MDNHEFICLDCETTGLKTDTDRVLEIAVVRFRGAETLNEFESLINPRCPIPEDSIAIHHITQEMVKDKPTIDTVLPEILEMIGDRIIIGHNIHFDVNILLAEAKRAGISSRLNENQQIDTLRLARLYGGSPVNSLEELRKHFNIPMEGAHRAMNDVVVNVQLFSYLIKQFRTLKQLFSTLEHPILLKNMPLGKYKGRKFEDIPLDYLRWAVRLDFDQDLIHSLRTEINRRKTGRSFSHAGNPFADL